MNIYEKLSAITKEMKPVEKSLIVNGQYHAVGEQDVLPQVRVLENQYGIYSYVVNQEVIESEGYITISNKGVELHNRFLRVKVTYRFVNIDKPDEYIETVTYADGVDTQDKAPGKAVTYAVKYALMKAYKMNTGEDPDMYGSPVEEDDANEIPPSLEPQNANVENETKAEAIKLEINLERVAKANGVTVDKITEEMLKSAIAQKKEYLEKKAVTDEKKKKGN